MRKTIASTLLSIIISLLMVPIAFADETEDNNFGLHGSAFCQPSLQIHLDEDDFQDTVDEDNKVTKSGEQKIQDWITDWVNTEYSNQLTPMKEKCGEPVYGFLEKGDCVAAGKVVTEVTEVFAADTKTSDGDNQVVTVYKGLCCLIYDLDSNNDFVQCRDSRAIYTDSMETCEKNGILCEKRQWIIGVSGAGIIKVYVKQIYSWGAGMAGFIAVVVIIISGVQIQLSGVSGDISQAKQRIMQSIAGLVLIFLSGIILYTVNPGFFS